MSKEHDCRVRLGGILPDENTVHELGHAFAKAHPVDVETTGEDYTHYILDAINRESFVELTCAWGDELGHALSIATAEGLSFTVLRREATTSMHILDVYDREAPGGMFSVTCDNKGQPFTGTDIIRVAYDEGRMDELLSDLARARKTPSAPMSFLKVSYLPVP